MRPVARMDQLVNLRNTNAALRENIALLNDMGHARQQMMVNSMSGFVTAAFPSAPSTSFSSLSYNNVYAPLTLNWQIILYMYKTHGVLQAAVDMPVQDAFRGGLEFKSDEMDKSDLEDMDNVIEHQDIFGTIKQAVVWARLFGGGAIFVNVEGEDPAKPLDLRRLKGKKISFYHLNRWELNGSQGRHDKSFQIYENKVDASRVFTIAGKEAPYILKWILQGWGMSDFERLVEPFNLFLLNQNAIYDLLREAKVDVYRFEGFASQLQTDKGTNIALNRIQAMNRAKNNGNAIVLDKLDEFEQKQITFAGLAEMWNQNRIGLASAIRIPMTKLFGISASGFNSGEDDIENYNGYVESDVREHAKPLIRKMLEVLQSAVYGEVFDLKFAFKPLRILSSTDEETIKASKNTRYMSLYTAGLVTPQEMMQLQQKEGLINIETEVARGADPEAPLLTPEPDDEDSTGEEDKNDTTRGGDSRAKKVAA